jgi:glycine/D-amino acid oxidase-like deaminating enzyme
MPPTETIGQTGALASLHWLQNQSEVTGTEGPMPARADVVIIGGGYVGGATAYWLARRGVQAVLIERRGISTGATGRNAGFIAPGLGMAFAAAVARYGREGALQRLNFTRRGRDLALKMIEDLNVECSLEALGGLTLAASDEEWGSLRASGAALREAGAPIEVLGRKELQAHLDTELPDRFRGALFNPESLLVNPAALNNAIVRAAQSLGASIYLGTEVGALTDTSDGRISVETSRGSVNAGRVVLATNAWSPQLAGFLRQRINPVRGQVLATEPAPRVFRHAMSTNYGYEYWSQRADGTIVLGGARWATADRDEGYYAEELNHQVQGALYGFLTGTFPALAGVKIARRWSGIMGFSQDGYPFIGPIPGRERLIVAAGFTGHGGPYFAITGKSVAELIVDGKPEEPIANYALDRAL